MTDERILTRVDRRFYSVVCGVLCVLFMLEHFLLPFFQGIPSSLGWPIAVSLVDKLFFGLLIAAALAAFQGWANPPGKFSPRMTILFPKEIGDRLVDARRDADRWWYSGASGRYTRNETLPHLAQRFRTGAPVSDIMILLLDPNNKGLLQKYADYRSNLQDSGRDANLKSLKGIRLELLSTIVSAYAWKAELPTLQVRIGLKGQFSLFRYDLSTSALIMTKEDPREPGVLCERGSALYSAFYQDLTQAYQQAIPLDMTKPFVSREALAPLEVRKLLESLKLGDGLTDDDCITITKQAKSGSNPYG